MLVAAQLPRDLAYLVLLEIRQGQGGRPAFAAPLRDAAEHLRVPRRLDVGHACEIVDTERW